ncbi:pimeloyl-ACP methyl ester carboxylesterase [Kibdelosporangium banguiense]|uniref:Pimeloyl-ACP methyl ester carboxylesterase n=1 Tax=Kibdelosporangium banguiense TaxID=1365924 RepID=A0ABS4TWN7_9PSEU|nr:alpha/beta hydrolase [Kibdelosporangium banguiense]MBP2328812.1 pimeloyl-ACP methyl ester carboxylesterase [Kibdelosporangium banguiense]
MTTTRRNLLAGSAAVAAGAAVGVPAAEAQPRHGGKQKPTVVLVHGAFADASGWNDVAARLMRAGYPVIAPANPLRGVAVDSAYLASVLATLGGPLVLVGHSYGGNVITNAATGNANVKALVYIAAFAPDQGETLLGLQTKYPGSQIDETALDFRPHSAGVDAYIKKELFHDVFAGDVPKAVTSLMWVSQRPVDTGALQEPSGAPAWKTIPSWCLVSRNDKVLPAAAQRFMAQRARAHTVEAGTSHVAMIAQPAPVADLIKRAAG